MLNNVWLLGPLTVAVNGLEPIKPDKFDLAGLLVWLELSPESRADVQFLVVPESMGHPRQAVEECYRHSSDHQRPEPSRGWEILRAESVSRA